MVAPAALCVAMRAPVTQTPAESLHVPTAQRASMQAPQTITISDADFEQTEKLLRQMGERAKTDARSWHQTEWTAEKLEAQGFGRINSPTILVREDGKRIATVMYGTTSFKAEGKAFTISASNALSLAGSAVATLGEMALGTDGRQLRPMKRGQSHVKTRDSKRQDGHMMMYGSKCERGANAREGDKEWHPEVYMRNHAIDAELNGAVSYTANMMSILEGLAAPGDFQSRHALAERVDPEERHRMAPFCSGFSLGLSTGYIVAPHDDSSAANELIVFVNRTGPLPDGHQWLFLVNGYIIELPKDTGQVCMVSVAPKVHHGTLPTSSTQETHVHGNLGAALVDKHQFVLACEKQRARGGFTRPEDTASVLYGVAPRMPPPKPLAVSGPVSQPPAASQDGETTGGDGGCTAAALANIGVFASKGAAARALDAQIKPLHAKFVRERGECDESDAGIRGEQWHSEAICEAVKTAGWHFKTVPIHSGQAKCVDLRDTLKDGSYLIIGVVNARFQKHGKMVWLHPGYPANAPHDNPDEWIHSIAVTDGSVQDFDRKESLAALWLQANNQPKPEKGYMRTIRKVWRVYKCVHPGTGCKGDCAASRKRSGGGLQGAAAKCARGAC